MSEPIPSGAYTAFSLQSGSGRLVGSGGDWGLMGVHEDSFRLEGSYTQADSAVVLSVAYSTGGEGSFIGRWWMDSLIGSWTPPGQPAWASAKFYRESSGGLTPQGQSN